MANCRVLHLRATNFYGGPERQLHLHARRAAGTDLEITVSSFSEGGRTPRLLDAAAADGIPTHLFEVSSAYDSRAVDLVKGYLRDSHTDILCTHDYRTGVIGWRATRGIDTRWVAFSRGWTSENFKTRLFHSLDKFVLRFADRIVAVSLAQKKKLRSLLISGDRIAVVHNAVVPEEFDSTHPVDLRQRYELPGDAIICIAGGRFSKEKGQIYLAQAAAACVQSDPRIHVIMFGNGPSLESVRRLVAGLGLDGHVLCPGFEDNLIGCLKGADILINPSLSEGLPNIVLEALAVRVPVVATSVGGVPELVEDERCGLLVPPKDSRSLATAIGRLAGDADLRARFASSGFERVKESFSFEKQFRELERVYHEVLGIKGRQHD